MRSRTVTISGLIWALCAPAVSPAQATQNPPLINYSSQNQSLMSGITAISLQSRSPVGIVLGADYKRLCETRATLTIRDSNPRDALEQFARLSGYSVSDKDGVLVLLPPDLPSWESDTMDHRFELYPRQQNASMASLGVNLTAWIQMVIGHETTFAASIMSAPGVKTYTFNEMKNATISDIANRIVKLPGGGIWILRPDVPHPSSALDLEVRVFSYLDDPDQIQTMTCEAPNREHLP